jgi:AraC-like DNA-binding protein
MKPLLQKLPLTDNTSFVAKTFRTPHFEVGWHQHAEYELILFTEGSGLSFIGNHVGDFTTGDIYFLGAHLPHTFQKSGDQVTSAVVVQFKEEIFGTPFLQLPELQLLRALFEQAGQGLKITGNMRKELAPKIRSLEQLAGLPRILNLLHCLHVIAVQQEFITVCTQDRLPLTKADSTIDKIFQYTIDHFQEKITLDMAAAHVHLSVSAFCHYFKRSSRKTYIDFLNEIRTSYACRLLTGTDQTIGSIGFECGYNSIGHFHKQFHRIKGVTPLQYRKHFGQETLLRGNNIGIVPDSSALSIHI